MKGKDLLEAMEYLDDDIIEAAHEDKPAPKYAKHRIFISLAACAACIFVLLSICVVPMVQKARKGDKEKEGNLSDSAVNHDWKEILIPSAGEISLSEDVRAVDENDIYKFNIKWMETGKEAGFDFFYDFMNSNKIQVSGRAFYPGSYYDIVEGSEVLCSVAAWDSSMSAGYMIPTFFSRWSYSRFHMNQYKSEELTKYLNGIRKRKNTIQEQIKYLAKYLKENDYGGSCYDTESGNLIVWLINGNYKTELEQQGIVCETARYSMRQLYEKMHELWDKREELGIIDISIHSSDNKLSVYGSLKEKEFWEKLNQADLNNINSVNIDFNNIISYNELPGNTLEEKKLYSGMSGARGIEDLDEFITFLQALYTKNHPTETPDAASEEYFSSLKTALIKLKEKYPEYTYLQIYYHVSTDCDYEYYLNFDKNLENFINTLPEYRKDMDFLKEQQYGDPQRLGLKAVLYYYKQLYPKESYQDLYNTYLASKNLETAACPKSEKLYQYLYIKAVQKKELEEKQKEKTDAVLKELHFLLYLFLGCTAMFLILFLCAYFKKKRMEKTEFRRYLVRETAALSANIALFMILPHLLYLMAGPTDIMSAVFLPDSYLGPLFGLFGSAIYTRRKGSWWNFMLYTTVCLILQPLAILESAGALYIVFLIYILPAEILGTLYGKLKGKIKIVK